MRRRYGAGPLHLAGHLLVIAAAAWALAQAFTPAFTRGMPLNLALWLLGGALVHDLVLLPAYTGLDRGVRAVAARARAGSREERGRAGWRGVPLVGHVRVPAVMAGALLLVYLPGILDRAPRNVVLAAGRERPDLLARWLALAAALFVVSALVWVVRVVRLQRAGAADEHVAAAADGD